MREQFLPSAIKNYLMYIKYSLRLWISFEYCHNPLNTSMARRSVVAVLFAKSSFLMPYRLPSLITIITGSMAFCTVYKSPDKKIGPMSLHVELSGVLGICFPKNPCIKGWQLPTLDLLTVPLWKNEHSPV